ncbi:MAG: hypothetical protein JNJ46_12570 [Myxococcales bacterium]|nr:hypothetical protein [Myxococcales bacterium]
MNGANQDPSTARLSRSLALQGRICDPLPLIQSDNPKRLLRQIQNYLVDASNERKLITSPGEIFQLVKLLPPKKRDEFLLEGADKNELHDPNRPKIEREDGCWFHFFIIGTAAPERSKLLLLGYHFEMYVPDENRFFRYDLNSPTGEARENVDKGMRSHLHLNAEDVQLPAPAMTPFELLDFFVYGFLPRNQDRRRIGGHQGS